MNLKKLFFVFVVSAATTQFRGQSVLKLEKKDFETLIINQWWSLEDKVKKNECDMRIFVVKPDEFELNCINWTNGFSGSKCSYALTIKNNFFELRSLECKDSVNPGFLYGYLSSEHLFLFPSKNKLALNENLLSQNDWLKLSKIAK